MEMILDETFQVLKLQSDELEKNGPTESSDLPKEQGMKLIHSWSIR